MIAYLIKRIALVFCGVLLLVIGVNAQKDGTRLLSGVVTNADGSPLQGASVIVKGTLKGTSTDEKGRFSVDVPASAQTLVISLLGYKEQEIAITADNNISVKLNEESRKLDEVVVIGYGTQAKRNVTGSVAKVDMKQTENLPNTNFAQSLRGRVAGVQFTDNGRPGQNGSILIRGQRSISAGNSPLIVLDGIIFNGSYMDINPNDILSMEVLKDASASAIYGSRAANGVILITSKKGSTEKPTIRINAYYGKSDFSYKVKLLSPERYIQKTLDYRREAGLPVDLSKIDTYLAINEAENYKAGKTIDPWEEASQPAGISSLDVSVSGKSKLTNYYLSASIANEQGLIYNDQQKRLSLRSNVESKITDWLTIGMNAMFSKRNMSGLEANVEQIMRASPYGTWFYDDGEPREFTVDAEASAGNPVRRSILNHNEEIYNNLFAGFFTVIDFPFIKGLSYRFNYSPNYQWSHNYNFQRQDKYLTANITSARKLNREYFDWLLENILTYKGQFGRDHAFDVTLLYGRNQRNFENTHAIANRLSSDALGWNNLSLGETLTNESSAWSSEGISSMLRVNYRLKEKYLLTLTARRDGSSVFAVNNKYATFPSTSIAWIASDESFMQKAEFIDLLKVRLSYGAVGNQAIDPYQSLSFSGTTRYVYGDGGESSLGVYPQNMANSNLKWETTYTLNAAIDFELLNGRLGGTLEVYNMNTKDLLITRTLPPMTGYSSVMANLGATNNKGIELTLNTVNIRTRKFEWSTNFNFSRNKNKIVHIYQSDTDGDGKEDDDLANRWFIGQPIKVYYDYEQDGIYQKGDPLPNGYKEGFIKLKDRDNSGVVDAADRTILGQGNQPKYRWSITNNFNYGNLSLSVFINAMQGWISDFGLIGRGPVERSLNFIDAGWWTPENQSNTRPALLYENAYGHNFYVSRDFVRIQDVSLAYTFPKNLLDKIKMSALRVFLSGKNLHTFTKWIGSDPESGATSMGDMFPMPRTVTVGINLGL